MTGVSVVPATELDATALAVKKDGRAISVCLPARNEAETVGPIVSDIVSNLMTPAASLVDELLVFDDGSTDATASIAAERGATVIAVGDVLPGEGNGKGKGNVLWRSVAASRGDIIVWCDTDLTSFTPAYVTRLVAPLLENPFLALVKGYYERPVDGVGSGGGRTTELVARPLLSMFFPDLATIRQPLGGEAAATRSLLERLPFVESYGVESALLIDTLQLVGAEAMAQVDLGVRRHRHRPLSALSEQASEVMSTILGRAGVRLPEPLPPLISQSGELRPIDGASRPPLCTIDA